jgi:hypothetical protein
MKNVPLFKGHLNYFYFSNHARSLARQPATARSTWRRIFFARGRESRKYAMTDISASIVASGPVSVETHVFSSLARSGNGSRSNAGASRQRPRSTWRNPVIVQVIVHVGDENRIRHAPPASKLWPARDHSATVISPTSQLPDCAVLPQPKQRHVHCGRVQSLFKVAES